MEMMAAIMALEALKRPSKVDLYTDSNYLRDGIMKWIHGWKRHGWKTAGRQPVKNVDLWQRLEIASERHDDTWNWVRGHAGQEGKTAVWGSSMSVRITLCGSRYSKKNKK